MEVLVSIYAAVGLFFGLERLSRITKNDEPAMVNIGIISIIVLWPLYIIYKVWKKRRNK